MKHFILYALIISALGIRVYGGFIGKKWFSHDEAISYMAAAGKQEKFKYDYNYGQTIVPTSKYKEYYEYRHVGDLTNVSRGMATTDNHPPLYWWLLHFAMCLFGVQTWTGLILNLVFSLLLVFVTYKLALLASNNKTLALLSACIFFISPTVNQIDYEARQYQVFALMAITFLYLNFKVHFNEVVNRTKHYIGIFLVTVLGLLSHYYFGIIVFGAMVLFLLKNGITKTTIIYFSVLLASLISFFALFPEFFLFMNGAKDTFVDFKEAGVPLSLKIYLMVVYSAEFFGYHRFGQVLFVVFVGTVLYVMFRQMKHRWNFLILRSNLQSKKWYVLYMLFWTVAFTAIFFAAQLTPAQAIGEQYFSYIWPLLSIAIAFVIYRLNVNHLVTYAWLGIMCVGSYFSTVNSRYVKEEFPLRWFEESNRTELFLSNMTNRGNLFRYAYFLKPDVGFYAGRIEADKLKLGDYDTFSLLYYYDTSNELSSSLNIIKEKGYVRSSAECTPDSAYCFFTFKKDIQAGK